MKKKYIQPSTEMLICALECSFLDLSIVVADEGKGNEEDEAWSAESRNREEFFCCEDFCDILNDWNF